MKNGIIIYVYYIYLFTYSIAVYNVSKFLNLFMTFQQWYNYKKNKLIRRYDKMSYDERTHKCIAWTGSWEYVTLQTYFFQSESKTNEFFFTLIEDTWNGSNERSTLSAPAC